jgi:hypothetical protein
MKERRIFACRGSGRKAVYGGGTALNRGVSAAAAVAALGFRSPSSIGLTASFARLTSPTFWAGVRATPCPFTRPKRRKRPSRYAPFSPGVVRKNERPPSMAA